MSDLNQSFLTERDSANITVESTGAVLRPALFIVSSMADEAKWRFEEDGVSVKVVDPTNVSLVAFEIPASAFDVYDIDEAATVGFNHKHLRKSMAMARHSSGSEDPIRIDTKQGQATVTVDREYGDTDVDHRQTFTTIDPDSVRQEPNLPEIELPNSAVVDTRALYEVISSLDARVGVRVGGSRESLRLADEPDPEAKRLSRTELSAEVHIDDPDAVSIVSSDYIDDVADALYRAHINTVEVRWGDEFPVRFLFERELDGEPVMSGEMMIAPRIES